MIYFLRDPRLVVAEVLRQQSDTTNKTTNDDSDNNNNNNNDNMINSNIVYDTILQYNMIK